jgi:mercuric ion transport protein
MSTDTTRIAATDRRKPGGTSRIAFAAGGLLAAFGVASCCALPIALSALGISAASLVGIGFLAAPYQRELLLASMLCLAAVAFLTWRQRRASTSTCATARTVAPGAGDWLTAVSVLTAVGLIVLTFWIDSPL